jgi:hypothetical protein
MNPSSGLRWTRSKFVVLIAMTLCLAGGVGLIWIRWNPRPRWNVIFITLDTTRSDRIGCYVFQQGLTPVLDGLAQRGVLFERAYTSAPLTLSARASMFTGLYAPEHGIRTNGKSRLSDDLPTLAESFLARGYATSAFIASFVLDSKFGLDRGFQHYDDDLTPLLLTRHCIATATEKWLSIAPWSGSLAKFRVPSFAGSICMTRMPPIRTTRINSANALSIVPTMRKSPTWMGKLEGYWSL